MPYTGHGVARFLSLWRPWHGYIFTLKFDTKMSHCRLTWCSIHQCESIWCLQQTQHSVCRHDGSAYGAPLFTTDVWKENQLLHINNLYYVPFYIYLDFLTFEIPLPVMLAWCCSTTYFQQDTCWHALTIKGIFKFTCQVFIAFIHSWSFGIYLWNILIPEIKIFVIATKYSV